MHAATEVIGMMAWLTSFMLWLPQGARVWKHRNDPAQLQGIVLSTQVISLMGNALWGVYALLIGSFWLGAPSLVNGPIAVATLVVVGRAHRASTTVPRTTAGAPAATIPAPRRTPTGSLRIVDVRQLAAA